jgi:hypothetical protein
MYEFLIGIGFGVAGTMSIPRPKNKDAGVQCENPENTPTPPMAMPARRKSFVPGELVNFWGKDS